MSAQTKKIVRIILFIAILALGILLRAWKFGSLPPGLNSDEASIAADASSLLHFGMDRNGMTYPIFFISWGSGQNALYGYLLIPFLALFGMSPTVIRLPMLLSSIATLPLVYLLGREIEDEDLGLLAMFFVAVSPWNIILSHWALESNILPFVFLAGFVLLLKAIKNNNNLFVAACFVFGLCLYAYGTTYAFMPFFIVAASAWLLYKRQLRIGPFLAGALVLFIVALPMMRFVYINTFKLSTIRYFGISIPRLPSLPRYEGITSLFSRDVLQSIWENIVSMAALLVTQNDTDAINTAVPYGYFYLVTFPLIALGIWQLARTAKEKATSVKVLVLIWITASVFTALFENVNVNRINIIFIPLITCAAVCVYNFNKKYHWVVPASSVALLVACGLFMHDFQGERYLSSNRAIFFVGLVPAIQYATANSQGEICISTQYHGVTPEPEVYALVAESLNPAGYLPSIQYTEAVPGFRQALAIDRYSLGMANCKGGADTAYIFNYQDDIPLDAAAYAQTRFDDYIVYLPKKN
jgi:uncharacterized membrane protein